MINTVQCAQRIIWFTVNKPTSRPSAQLLTFLRACRVVGGTGAFTRTGTLFYEITHCSIVQKISTVKHWLQNINPNE